MPSKGWVCELEKLTSKPKRSRGGLTALGEIYVCGRAGILGLRVDVERNEHVYLRAYPVRNTPTTATGVWRVFAWARVDEPGLAVGAPRFGWQRGGLHNLCPPEVRLAEPYRVCVLVKAEDKAILE